MPVGDVKSGMSSIASGSYLTIQPASGEEWVIHNISWATKVDIEWYDGSNSLVFHIATIGDSLRWEEFHLKNGLYLRVKNTDTVSRLIQYDGVQTR